MARDMNKSKKKRKISDSTLEFPTKKGKSNDDESIVESLGEKMKILDKPDDLTKGNIRRDKKKEKKKKIKRKGEEFNGNSGIEKKPKINGAPLSLTAHNGETIDPNSLAEPRTEVSDDSDIEGKKETTLSKEEAKKLSGKALRKSFNSQGGLEALRKFLVFCKENKRTDLAAEYLQAGGSVLEILRLLDTSDKKNLNNACTVFAAMHLIIMKILSEYPQYQSNAEEACRHFINSHLSFVHSMLSSQSNARQRKIVLRLLASMVSLGGTLPRELLAHLSFHTQVLETLSEQTKPTDSQSVRTCFVHFVLAYLVEGKASTIRAMLDKRGMLSCIFPGLLYDSHETVHLVLDTVKTWILENSAISKTSKLHVFSTPVLQSLVSLYNWKGPRNWPGPKGKKRETSKDIVDPEEKEIAVEAVHAFLITLLTSNRHGVIFHDRSLGTSGRKCNQLVNTVLQSLDRPWEHPKPLDLVVRVLMACPDLVKSQLTYTEAFLEPRASTKWILAMRFVGKVVESLDSKNCLEPCLPELSSSQLVTAVQNLTIPLLVMKNAIVPSFEDDKTIIRHEGIVILTKMLKQARAFAKIVEENSHETDSSYFKNAMIDYIAKNVPSLEMILKAWNLALIPEDQTIEQEETLELNPPRNEHLSAILDLLDAYREFCPERLDLSASGDQRTEILLTGLDELTGIESYDLDRMRVKALKFLLSVDLAAFAPNKKLFRNTLSFLLTLLRPDENESESGARETIKMLLGTSGMFEGCHDQIDIWIEGFGGLGDEEKVEVADWLVKVIEKTIKKTDKYLDQIVQAEESAGEQILSAERLEVIFNDLAERDSRNVGSDNVSPLTSISPIVCSAIEHIEKNPNEIIAKYLSYVLTLTLHCQITPGTLVYLTRNVQRSPAKKYLASWLEKEKPAVIKDDFPGTRVLSELSKIFAKNETLEIEKVFKGEKNIEFVYRDEKINISHDFGHYDVVILLRMTVFYLTQFMQRGEFTQDRFDSHKLCVSALLRIAKDLSAGEDFDFIEKCSRTVFAHPVILHYFSPFCGTKDAVEKIVTEGLVDICRTVVDLNEEESLYNLFLPFKNKLISQLSSAVKKNDEDKLDRVENPTFLMEYLEILRPTGNDVEDLLRAIMEFPMKKFVIGKNEFSIWANLVPKFLELLAKRRYNSPRNSTIDVVFVKKIVSCLTHFKTYRQVNVDSWESNLQRYLDNHPRNTAGVDGHAFNSLLKLSKSSTTMSLLSFLISRSDQYVPLFVNFVMSNQEILAENEVIFPLIATRSSYDWNRKFLEKLYDRYKDDIVKYFAEPENSDRWISRDVKATVLIIDSCFESEDCEKACEIVLSNGEKLDDVDLGYVKLVESIFRKSSKLKKNCIIPVTNLIQVLVRITVSILKKDSKNEEKLEALGNSVENSINHLKTIDSQFVFEDLNNNLFWRQFVRFSLMHGLKVSKDGQKDSSMLKMLVSACDIAYKDGSEHEYIKTLFEMTTSHSKFISIMLSSQTIKRDLLELLWVLVRKNHSVMSSSQIPLYLASYNATLTEIDQFILLILQHYENNGIKFNEYRPYLWGEAAATHYSVKGEADTALWRQPSTSQVLDLLDPEIIKNTIKHFPVHRELKPSEMFRAEKVYDPAFYLPLLSYLLSDNNVVACHKVTQSGALSLVFAASGSSCAQIRLAAYTVISRFYFHLEATSSKEKDLWIRLIDALRNGIMNTDSTLKDIRMSCLVSTFLARSALVTTQPMNVLYSPIQAFFMAKPALDLNTIPELLQLFHSSDIEHVAHRHWILEVVRDGMRTDFDTDIALKCVIFKMFLDFYTSVLADPISKRLILQIIESTVKIAKTGLLVLRSYGLLAWLNEISLNFSSRDTESIDIVVSITRETLSAVARTKGHEKEWEFLLLNLLKGIKACLSKNTSVATYDAYVVCLSEIMRVKSFRAALTRDDLQGIIEHGKQIYGDVEYIEETLNTDGQYTLITENAKTSNDELTRGRESLRRLVLTWCGHGTRL